MVKPVLAAVTIMTSLGAWRDFIRPRALLTKSLVGQRKVDICLLHQVYHKHKFIISVVEQELERLDRQIRQATIQRPAAEQVQTSWGQLVDLWPELTEEERETLLQAVVQRVEAKEKNLVFCELSPITEARGSKFEVNMNWERGSDAN